MYTEICQAGPFSTLAAVRARASRAESRIPGLIVASQGGQYRQHAHPIARDALVAAAMGKSLLGFFQEQASARQLDLADYLGTIRPPAYSLDLRQAYLDLHEKERARKRCRVASQSFAEFLEEGARQTVGLGPYPEATLGSSEVRSIFRQYFIACGIPVHKDIVLVGRGFKSLYGGALAVLLTDEKSPGVRVPSKGKILLRQGHYHSLVANPFVHGRNVVYLPRLDAGQIACALKGQDIRALLLTSVNNPTGEILSREQLTEIAAVLLEHNAEHPERPVFVISDEVYHRSILKPEVTETPSMASITFDGRRMHDYTITITSSSKTLGFAGAQVGFATCGNRDRISGLSDWLRQTGAYHLPPVVEIAVAAAFATVPVSWFEENNAYYREQVRQAREWAAGINDELGSPLLSYNDPDGGWYLHCEVRREDLPERIRPLLRTSDDLHTFLLYYGNGEEGTGVGVQPGSVLGYPQSTRAPLTFRLSVALPPGAVREMFVRLQAALEKLMSLEPEEMEAILSRGESRESHVEYQITAGGPW